jgi:hypothetical protein
MAKNKADEEKVEEAAAEDEVTEDEAFAEEQAAAAAAQSQEEPQVVPEVRPQGFLSATSDSEAGKRAAARQIAHGKAEYEAAKPKEGVSEGRKPHLFPGQRVQIIAPNEEAGRMASVQTVVYTDDIQDLLSRSGTPEASFATASSYVVLTRDGRSEILDVPAAEVSTLETIAGWGRGQI